jgi:hypothetical protein
MSNSSIHGAHAEHHVQPPASVIRERATPAKVPLASADPPARIEAEEKELPFTD